MKLLTLLFMLFCFSELTAQVVNVNVKESRALEIVKKVHPWKKNITATVFWVGEAPSGANKTANYASSWDQNWSRSYGGYDNPDPKARRNYIPKSFTPKQNPFYVALPYNDVASGGRHKPEASKVIPWFRAYKPVPGRTVCKGQWLQILHNGKSCFAQWEDCGPWTTTDHNYVFGNSKPQNTRNGGAGIDISPAVRDYLGLKSGEKCHWRFVPFHRIPNGPWCLYGTNNPFRNSVMRPDYKVKKAW